jgi:hypothetical protein
LNEHDFISMIFPIPPLDKNYDGSQEEFRAITLADELAKLPTKRSPARDKLGPAAGLLQSIRRALLPEDSDAPWWKKVLSAPPRSVDDANGTPKDDPAYKADDSGGKGTTIYVLDDGFDMTLAVWWQNINSLGGMDVC